MTAKLCFPMKLYHPLALVLLAASLAENAGAQAVIEGRVQLPKARSAPVMNKRYEIVTAGGVLAPNPPVAVVYLEGSFPLPASPPVQQIIQTNFVAPDPAIGPYRVSLADDPAAMCKSAPDSEHCVRFEAPTAPLRTATAAMP